MKVCKYDFRERITSLLEQKYLNPYSRDLLESFLSFAEKNCGSLTPKQASVFEKIEGYFNNPELEDWYTSFSQKKRDILHILAKYYDKTGYFYTLTAKILNDDKFIPTKEQYEKYVNNKYSRKVLENTFSVPKFEVNDFVQIVKKFFNLKSHFVEFRKSQKVYGFVLKVNSSPVTAAVRGGKKYKILPLGFSKCIEVEERFLRKANKEKL